jgi:hypothetical protein
MAFACYKGEPETTLLAAGFPRVLHAIYPAFRVLFPNQVIPADELGRTM